MQRLLFLVCCLAFSLAISACADKRPGYVKDLESLPQEAGQYQQCLQKGIFSKKRQQVLYADLKRQFFQPWLRATPKHTPEEVFWGLKHFQSKKLFGENMLPLSLEWMEHMEQQADVKTYPSLHSPAITVHHACMRVLPTIRPIFYDPRLPGEGFPFDYGQNTLVPAGTPLLITHACTDGSWALAETQWAAGWIKWSDLAVVDEKFIDTWTGSPLIGFFADQIPLTNQDGAFLASSRVGMILPLEKNEQREDTLLIPARDHLGRAQILHARPPADNWKTLPFPATAKNFVQIINSLMNLPYGWGGIFENRDCSALLQDIFRNFGVYLPRNSSAQAALTPSISLKGLDAAGKEQRILTQGKPLRTILYKPGHVMLYLGPDPASNRVVIFHTMWGLRTMRLFSSIPGRHVLGRAVITTLEPGREFANLVRPSGLLVNGLSSMILID